MRQSRSKSTQKILEEEREEPALEEVFMRLVKGKGNMKLHRINAVILAGHG